MADKKKSASEPLSQRDAAVWVQFAAALLSRSGSPSSELSPAAAAARADVMLLEYRARVDGEISAG